MYDNLFIDPKKWISATKLRNALVNNHYADLVVEGSLRGVRKNSPIIRKKNVDNFLFTQGILFEKRIIESIKAKFKPSQIVTIEEPNPYSICDYEKTKALIKKRTPIIFGGVLHNNGDFTFGMPDIIIRSDYLKKLFDSVPGEHDGSYAIIDVKFCTLQLKNDKFTLQNGLNFTPYKSQVLVYSRALDVITGDTSSRGYILGRGWKNRDEKINNPFSRPGVVEYTPDVYTATDRAIEWMGYVKRLDLGILYSFIKAPYAAVIPRKEIYPNMHYNLDPAWVWDAKNSFANAIGDISQMYMCGKIIKERALSNGVSSWRDPKFLDIIKGHKYFNNIKNIIEINNDNDNGELIINYEKVSLPKKALFLDFEVLADILHDNSFSSQIIFMIGIGYEKNGKFIYKEFTTSETTHAEESRICGEFTSFLEAEGLKEHTMVHWSHAESWQWAKARKRLSHDYNLKLFDLCEEFKKHAVSIRGAYNYSLKSIAKAMHSHGIIETVWPETGPANGIAAIEFLGKGGDMEIIKKYNKVDVQVLYQIGGGARPQNPPAGL